MSNDTQVKQEAPAQSWWQIACRYTVTTEDARSLLRDISAIAATARQEAFKEAVEIAKRHWVLVPAECENRPLDVQRWQGYNLAAKEIRAALEAAATEKK